MSTCSVSLTISGSPEEVSQIVEKVKLATKQTGPNQCEVDLAAIVESPDGSRFFGCHDASAIREVRSGIAELVGVADEYPPFDFTVALSKQWPDLAFDLRSGHWDEDVHISVTNGESVQKYLRQESFVATSVGPANDLKLPPLHHWSFYIDIPSECRIPEQAVLKTLRGSGHLLGLLVAECESRRDPIVLCQELSGVLECKITPRGIMRFTLDEKHYLDRLFQGLSPGPSSQPLPAIPEDIRQSIRVMERGIILTETEIDWLVPGLLRNCSGPFAVDRLERLRNQLGKRFVSQFGELLDGYTTNNSEENVSEWWTHPYVGLAESVHLGYGEYGPTTQELEMIHDMWLATDDGLYQNAMIAKERRAVLYQAMTSPRWSTFWPDWERKVVPQHSIERLFAKPYDGPDFLEQLRNQ